MNQDGTENVEIQEGEVNLSPEEIALKQEEERQKKFKFDHGVDEEEFRGILTRRLEHFSEDVNGPDGESFKKETEKGVLEFLKKKTEFERVAKEQNRLSEEKDILTSKAKSEEDQLRAVRNNLGLHPDPTSVELDVLAEKRELNTQSIVTNGTRLITVREEITNPNSLFNWKDEELKEFYDSQDEFGNFLFSKEERDSLKFEMDLRAEHVKAVTSVAEEEGSGTVLETELVNDEKAEQGHKQDNLPEPVMASGAEENRTINEEVVKDKAEEEIGNENETGNDIEKLSVQENELEEKKFKNEFGVTEVAFNRELQSRMLGNLKTFKNFKKEYPTASGINEQGYLIDENGNLIKDLDGTERYLMPSMLDYEKESRNQYGKSPSELERETKSKLEKEFREKIARDKKRGIDDRLQQKPTLKEKFSSIDEKVVEQKSDVEVETSPVSPKKEEILIGEQVGVGNLDVEDQEPLVLDDVQESVQSLVDFEEDIEAEGEPFVAQEKVVKKIETGSHLGENDKIKIQPKATRERNISHEQDFDKKKFLRQIGNNFTEEVVPQIGRFSRLLEERSSDRLADLLDESDVNHLLKSFGSVGESFKQLSPDNKASQDQLVREVKNMTSFFIQIDALRPRTAREDVEGLVVLRRCLDQLSNDISDMSKKMQKVSLEYRTDSDQFLVDVSKSLKLLSVSIEESSLSNEISRRIRTLS